LSFNPYKKLYKIRRGRQRRRIRRRRRREGRIYHLSCTPFINSATTDWAVKAVVIQN